MILKKGSRGTKVSKIQYKLGLKPDGIFGSGTEAKVKDWQDKSNLTVDGIIGEKSWELMFGSRIEDFSPIGVVVHSMSEKLMWEGKIITAEKLLDNLGLSVHTLIHPNGDIQNLLKTNHKAAHAGKSKHNGLQNLNSYFLGFELLVEGVNSYEQFIQKIQEPNCYSQNQIKAATLLTRMWISEYKIATKDVVRHSDISGDDVRGNGKGKVDPGSAFPWKTFKEKLS